MPAPPSSALVTGAGGVLGSVFVRHLAETGWTVRALSRKRTNVPAEVESIVADIRDTAAVRQAATGLNVIFHLAASVDTDGGRDESRELTDINVGGTRSVIRAAAEAGVSRVVYFSSTSVYGQTPRAATEVSQPAPSTSYARSKLDAEAFVLADNGVVLRVASAYGPHVEGRYLQLARLHRRGVLRLTGRNRRSLVFEKDLMNAATLAARHPTAPGRVFNVTDGEIHTLGAIIDAIRSALGCAIPAIPISVQWLGPLMSVAGVGARTGSSRRAWAAAARKLQEDSAVDGSAIQRELGFVPTRTIQSGWRETIAAWRSRDLL